MDIFKKYYISLIGHEGYCIKSQNKKFYLLSGLLLFFGVTALVVGSIQYVEVQTKIQELAVLSYEYSLRRGDSVEESSVEEEDAEVQDAEEAVFEVAATHPREAIIEEVSTISQSDYREIDDMKSSTDDDFVMLSVEEEKILSQTKAELDRYQKKIAQQRLAKKREPRSYRKKLSPQNKIKKRKVVAKKKLAMEGSSSRIPTMNQIKRKKIVDAFFDWPVDLSLFWLSSVYGMREHPRGGKKFHYGIDLAALKGTPVMAAAAGTIIQAAAVPGYGNNIIIKHNNQFKTRYAHLHKIYVKEGQKVSQGEKIASVGATGYVRKSGRDGSHLHFEIYSNGVHVNPLKYLLNE